MTNKTNIPDNIGSNISIRPYQKTDFDFVEKLQAKAFGPGRFARAAYRVREKFLSDDELGLIAMIGNKRVGSVSMTPISIAKINGYLLGPLVTDNQYRSIGIGGKLVLQATSNALKKAGEFTLLVGDLPYYGTMGFEAVEPYSIIFPSFVDQNRILISCKPDINLDNIVGELEAYI
ncbi:MAG: N-acetyltransferase [Devosiaceae bacterium]|nr:N-acetyltransferase [Devosiaceae bacterium]